MRVMWHCCKISQFLAFAHESSTSRHLNQGFASFTHAFSVRCRISLQVSIKVYRPLTPPANFMENLTNMTKEWQHTMYLTKRHIVSVKQLFVYNCIFIYLLLIRLLNQLTPGLNEPSGNTFNHSR